MNAEAVRENYRRLQAEHDGGHLDCDACQAARSMATILARHPSDYGGPVVYPRLDSDRVEARMLGALKELAIRGCSRLVPPHTCRREPGGYPRAEWCEGCIAADGLGLPADWFQLR